MLLADHLAASMPAVSTEIDIPWLPAPWPPGMQAAVAFLREAEDDDQLRRRFTRCRHITRTVPILSIHDTLQPLVRTCIVCTPAPRIRARRWRRESACLLCCTRSDVGTWLATDRTRIIAADLCLRCLRDGHPISARERIA